MTDTLTTPPLQEQMLGPQGVYADLMSQRNALVGQKLQSAAMHEAGDTIPKLSTLFHDDESRGGTGFGNTEGAYSRIEKRIVDRAAMAVGIQPIVADHLPEDATSAVVWEFSESGAVTLRFADHDGTLRSFIKKEREQADRPFRQLRDQLAAGKDVVVTEDEFKLFGEDQDVTMRFMGHGISGANPTIARARFLERLYALPVHLPGEAMQDLENKQGVYFDENGALIKVLISEGTQPGLYKGMYFPPDTKVDPSDTTFRLGIELHPDEADRVRVPNTGEFIDPFLRSKTGKEIVSTLQKSGLHPAVPLKEVLIEETNGAERAYADLWGNSYSELTREAAKFVNNGSRDTTKLFKEPYASAQQAIESIDTTEIDSEPAKVFFDLLQQSMSSNRDISQSDIPIYEGTIIMRAHSCRDSETLYLAARPNELKPVKYGEVTMLHKNLEGPTAINLQPLLYKGVRIPAGGLFQRHEDDKTGQIRYAFVRMTGFAFNPGDSRDAFTWQHEMAKADSGTPSSDTRQLLEDRYKEH